MNNLIILVGDNTRYLADRAHEIDTDAYLVEYSNLEHNHHGVVYTSIADVGVEGLTNLLFKATKIIYSPPVDDVWSDGATVYDRYSMAQTSYIYCKIISTLQQSKFEIDKVPVLDAPIIQPRASRGSNLWIAGCSTTAGVAVEPDEVYWKSIGDKLNIPAINLSCPGSSLQWQSDQLLRADLKKGDKVIWGLTYTSRLPWYKTGDVVQHLGIRFFDIKKKEAKKLKGIVSQKTAENFHWHHVGVRSIRQVENFCKKLGVELLLVGIHVDIEISSVLCSQSNFLMIDEQCGTKHDSYFLDYGTDGEHPGPLTHQMYSEKILNRIHKLGWL